MNAAAAFEGWNYGDLLDRVETVVAPAQPALAHGERTITWKAFGERSNRLARALLAGGAAAVDKVALYLRNPPAYLETVAAAVKARLVHVNVNYRYVADEVRYILENSDAS